MVERMSSVEIEDVLSSIRRLVTDDLRPKPVAVDNKLILTPALRVVPDVPAEPDSAEVDVLEVDLDADLTAALSADLPDDDADIAADAAMAEPAAFPMFLHRDRRVDVASDNAEAAFAPADFGETVSQISAGIPAEGYEAELGDVMAVPEWPESSWVAPDALDVVEEAELIPVPGSAADDPHGDWLVEPEAQGSFEDSVPETALDDDAAEAAALAALEAQDAAGLTELDEDMLREIVREIIREELHGSLGERITRNVRKLVRAEINRALITQDLE